MYSYSKDFSFDIFSEASLESYAIDGLDNVDKIYISAVTHLVRAPNYYLISLSSSVRLTH